jgi:hypothetical protein
MKKMILALLLALILATPGFAMLVVFYGGDWRAAFESALTIKMIEAVLLLFLFYPTPQRAQRAIQRRELRRLGQNADEQILRTLLFPVLLMSALLRWVKTRDTNLRLPII